jgi:hypothetical protein
MGCYLSSTEKHISRSWARKREHAKDFDLSRSKFALPTTTPTSVWREGGNVRLRCLRRHEIGSHHECSLASGCIDHPALALLEQVCPSSIAFLAGWLPAR